MGAPSHQQQTTLLDRPNGRNGKIRKCLATCILLSSVIILFYYTQYNTHVDQEILPSYSKQPQNDGDKYLIHTSTCKIPNDDPFNDDIKKFLTKEYYVPCSGKPLLSYIEKSKSVTTLHINQSLLETYSFFKISCCYSSVTRIVHPNKPDDDVRISECIPFEHSVNVTDFIILIRCRTLINSEIYSNVHVVVSPQHVQGNKLDRDWSGGSTPLSVLFVGIDSVSKMNLVRTMPQTHNFLETKDFLNLKGYTKIGDNTFPNLMAILTGMFWTDLYERCSPDKNKLNDCDIIWKKFDELGYITAYAEDETSIGTFNYNRQGFGASPTDFYFRPYLIAAEKLPSIKRFDVHTCSGPETSGERIMNLVKEFVSTFPNNPKFGLFWMNTFSHDNLNLPSSMDEKVVEFLNDIYHDLNDTILVFFSDHGFRFGDFRYTHTGWLEERLPFIYIHLPKRFKDHHVQQFNSLVTNTQRLTTPYDIHMTLQDVLALANHNYTVQSSVSCPKCHSLFKEVDEARTCKDAAIDQHWCMCSGYSYINPKGRLVVDVAEFIVSQINAIIKVSKQGYKCAHYYLGNVMSSGISEVYVNERNQSVNYFLIMLQTRPPAMFEATVEVHVKSTPDFRLLGDISRTNKYGDNSKCIQDSLKIYCYCDGLFTSIKSAICNFLNCV